MKIKLLVSNYFTKDEKEMIRKDIEKLKNKKQLMDYLESFRFFLDVNPIAIYIFKKNISFEDIGDIEIY